jgi:UDP-N-acetylmuramoyl-tripeptide--D-alanyl-D-alanine ligase
VITALPAHGVAVFPQDDTYTPVWLGLSGARRSLQFAGSDLAPAQIACINAQWAHGAWQVNARTPQGALRFALHIAGRHNVKNAMAAASCALAAGVDLRSVVQGLEQFVPVKGRSRALSIKYQGQSRTLVDDTYNANPDSVRAAIDVLAELPGPRLLVLGDMGEVGEQGPQFHAEAGRYAKACGIEYFFATGALARFAVAQFEGGLHFDSVETLIAAVPGTLAKVQSVLVKGSRFMRMERVVDALVAQEAVHAA